MPPGSSGRARAAPRQPHAPLAAAPLLLLALLAAALAPIAPAAGQGPDVITLGGFVSVSPKLAEAAAALGAAAPDLSAVRVALFSAAGLKQAEGDCSPNGYYFVPVEPGAYTVRVHGPPGWAFTPAEMAVTCDAAGCNGGADANFALAGVELAGHVAPGPAAPSCRAAAPAYAGITVAARPAGAPPRERPAATAKVADSAFALGPLLPGDYVVSASHASWALQPGSTEHALRLDAPQLRAPFLVAGYRLSGSVTSRSGPVAGIQITLLSTELETAPCSAAQPPRGAATTGDLDTALSTTPLCSTVTDDTGSYAFAGVPCGRYTLQAAHPDLDASFDIQPPALRVSVGHGNAAAPEPFVVAGFSVSGRVVDAAGNGVPSVSVAVDGEERANTDLNGRYVLARMHEGRVDVTASKQFYEFSRLTAVQVTPSAQALPDIQVTGVAACGRLVLGDQAFRATTRAVSVTTLGGTGRTVRAEVDDIGKFCIMVPPGQYRVAPAVPAEDRARGLVLAPPHADVDLSGGPVLNLMFQQAQLAVLGSVVCLDGPCPGDVRVAMRVASTGNIVQSAALSELAPPASAPALSRLPADATPFMFARVRPGSYVLTASRPGWCWQAGGVRLDVNAAFAEAAPLLHLGYELQITCSHATDLSILGGALQQALDVSAAPGKTSVCLPASGDYSLTPSGCFHFPGAPYPIRVPPQAAPAPLELAADSVTLRGEVAIGPAAAGELAELPARLTMTATPAGGGAPVTAHATLLPPGGGGATAGRLYDYSLTVPLGAALTLVPSLPSDAAGGTRLLFQPGSVALPGDVAAAGCPPPLAPITALPGLMLQGDTQPPVEGASVKVLYAAPSPAAGAAAGDVAAEGATDASGVFSLGPLHGDAAYTVELAKPGHVFEQAPAAPGDKPGRRRFVSKQLAQVRVRVELPAGTDPTAVFLSLSGSAGFKHNARLGPELEFLFTGLQPGTYYLKPLLREHQFEPPVADLSLADGQAAEVRLRAAKSAWGISGAVKSVGGAPLAGAVVEACQGAGAAAVVLDSAVTDESGSYRVGHLKPDSSYLLRVRLDGRVISAHPAGKQVELARTDVSGIDFTAFRTGSRSSLSAALSLPAELRSAVRAELLPVGSAGAAPAPGATPAGAASVDGSGFFELRGLKPGAYVLRLSCVPAAAVGGLGCQPWETAVQVASKDVHLGLLSFAPASPAAAAAAAAAAGAAATAGLEPLSQEGLDWKLPVIVLLLFVGAAATVLQPALSDILQLRPAAGGAAPAGAASAGAAPAAGGGGNGRAGAASPAAAAAAARAAEVKAAADVSLADEWAADDGELRSLGMKTRATGMRTRARRA